MAGYQHHPLNNSSSEIRLVNLQPGHHDEPIKVTLKHASFNDEAVYEALSYTWGDPNVTVPITIHDLPFEVTINLESALRHLRLEAEPRVIWIDAICIQQRDVDERDQQIRIMESIYAKARRVVVWLGPETDDSNLALEIIGDGFCQRIIGREGAEISLPEDSTWPESTRRLKAVVSFFNRTWWRRGWIIQEVLERNNVHIYCGRTVKPWDVVCRTIENFEDLSWRSQRSKQLAGGIQMHTNDPLWDALAKCTIPARLLFRLQGLDLEGWLHCLRFFDTTDPKDKFWIAASLAGDNLFSNGQGPQYGWSLAHTYSFIVPHLLETRRDLRVLEHCSFSSSELPSWIPDWRVPVHAPISDWRVNNMASARSNPVYKVVGETLHLKGFLFDTAKAFPPTLLKDERIDVESLLGEATNLGVKYRPTNELSKNALIRALHADLAYDIQEAYIYLIATPEEQKGLDIPLAYPVVKSITELDTFAETFFVKQRHACKYAFTGRKYFRSSTGYIGLVPEATKEGDKICIFFGGNTPFVIRPSGNKYLLIGACYVHGIMKGEAMVDFEKKGGVSEDVLLI